MTERSEFTDVEGLVDPECWPYRPGRPDLPWAEEMRTTIRQIGAGTRELTQDLAGTWAGLSEQGVYESPEAPALHGAMSPVVRDGMFEARVCDTAVRAVDAYIEDRASLEQRLRSVEADAASFRNGVVCGIPVPVEDLPFVRVPGLAPAARLGVGPALGAAFETLTWREHRPSIERNQVLVAQIAGVTQQIRDAEAQLAKRLLLADDVGGRGGAPVGLDRIDAVGRDARGGFVPDRKWFENASDEEFLRWWRGLAPWEQEAARDAVEAMDLDTSVAGGRIADALRDVTDRPDGYDDVATLDAVLQVFGQDKAAMEYAFTGLGIAGLGAALNGVAGVSSPRDMTPARRKQKLSVLSELRESLSEVSAGWDMATAREFAAERDMEDVGWYVRPELGYLFADQHDHPMGKNLTLAMADELDRLERGDLEGPAAYYEPPMSPLREILVEQGHGRHSERVNDPTGRVLGTLGEYPEAALGWLSDEGLDEWDPQRSAGEARLRYYFQTRDWASSGDGFEGVAALWSGTQRAEGGPLDGDHYDPDTWTQVATVTTRVAEGLEANPAFLPENMSALGAAELSGGLVQSLPELAHIPIGRLADQGTVSPEGDIAPREDPYHEGQHLPGFTGERTIPKVSRAEAAELFAAAAATPESSELLRNAAIGYQDALIDMAGDGTIEPDKAIRRAGSLQAVIDGARHGGEAETARRQDEAVERVVARIEDLATSYKAKGPRGAVINRVLRAVVDKGDDYARSTWAQHLARAQAEHSAQDDDLRAEVQRTAETLADDLGVTDPDLPGEVAADYWSTYNDFYARASDGSPPIEDD
ncbi:hypothetical protein [Myceligenerans indicum]|uniref:ESX-1 secretion-associated protein EspA/EspE-like domain-containing protein n=1 Tax=Myceligenerans indicum TaxID=2593663 RepID=A0ABS1LQ17_9MICO|nr:hypothetical protein [Myceligenerans indicum]MBL0888133.1 hypothetical protein [Myceligenerans indicum]